MDEKVTVALVEFLQELTYLAREARAAIHKAEERDEAERKARGL